MPTSRQPRSTHRLPTSTCAASISRRTRARNRRAREHLQHGTIKGRPAISGAALAFIAIGAGTLAACGGGNDGAADPTSTSQAASPTSRAASTGSDTPARRDLADLARRFRDLQDAPRRVALPTPVLGELQQFHLFVLSFSSDTPSSRRLATMELRAISDHAYFFVERNSSVSDSAVENAAQIFEDEVWPAVTGEFGLPDSPGVDSDPRIAIVHGDLQGFGGYVTEEDAYTEAVVPFSNQREAVYLDVKLQLGSGAYAQVLAHELQHLIHRRLDPDEEAWINEGLSEAAYGLLGQRGGYFLFLNNPDLQLNTWDSFDSAHYDASDLFVSYLLEQTGRSAGELAAEPANGLDGVRALLRAAGDPRSVPELVADWAVANLLDELTGPYGYSTLLLEEPALEALFAAGAGDVHQFAADYVEITRDVVGAGASVAFEGDAVVPVLAAQAGADGAFWWSGRGDDMDSTLTREVDLRNASDASLTFRTWFNIENSFDWAYVAASRDGGQTWSALGGEHTGRIDSLGVSYGPGYTGTSGGGQVPEWVDERIDLSAYDGEEFLLRFEYVTDAGLNEPGWAIDDIEILAAGFRDGAEFDAGGWHREGFRRLSDPLEQQFELRLVTYGGARDVQRILPDAQNRAVVTLPGLGIDYNRAVLVIMGVTEGTTEKARYRLDLR